MSTEEVKVYDAEGMVVGRLGAKIAKAALLGDRIAIINAEKAIITGDRRTVIESFKEKFNIRTSYKPSRGPFHERRPDKMIRKMIRGMLPWPTPRGKAAYKRIKVYIGVPEEFSKAERIVLDGSRYTSLTGKHITVGDLSHELGWRNPEVA
ncbi:MAG: 50S ribosomal protein L13 [Candidatus Thorarchaeota archaeon]|nr:MAG: 50S ribosomal protein L13 [Candidatus Thorarchaeota archaeon]RLI60268.1 MAG: 50S ribosomal protein L13 [Candidatus Thorarchaeota archaeon]